MLPAPSGDTSYGVEKGIGSVYSTILPVFGSIFPNFPSRNAPSAYQIIPLESIRRRFSTQGVFSGEYSVNFSVAGSNFANLQRIHSAIQSLSFLSTTRP